MNTYIPYTCPVCKGQGLVSTPPWLPGDQLTWVASTTGGYPCKVCGDKGIIWYTVDLPQVPLP